MTVIIQPGLVSFEKGGVTRFSTDAPPVNLLMTSQVTPTVAVNFPEFAKDWIYGYAREDIDIYDPFKETYHIGYAVIISKIIPGEWSASEVIGSVPVGCNYIDVRAVLTWTKLPSASGGSPVRSPLSLGSQVHLQGGSGVLEIGSGFRRSIHVGLVGSDVVLTRYQSARSQLPVPNYDAWGGPTQTGWSYLSSPYGTAQNLIGKATRFSTGPFTPPYRGGPQQASVSAPDDHSSNWSIQFVITPGRINSSI